MKVMKFGGSCLQSAAGLKRMIEAQKAVGAITGDVDYDKLWDTRFLPDDQKAMK